MIYEFWTKWQLWPKNVITRILQSLYNFISTLEDGKDGFALAAFLCFAEHSQFCILRPVRADGQFGLKHLATVFAPEYDLIDYSVTPYGRIVALWTNPDGVPMLRYADFARYDFT